MARHAGFRLLAVGSELWLFDRVSGAELGKWDRETRRLTLGGRRAAGSGCRHDGGRREGDRRAGTAEGVTT